MTVTHTGMIRIHQRDEVWLPNPNFHKNVFINCPFDEEYKPILQAILFCLIRLGFVPKIANEIIDSGENRLENIQKLIHCSKYSIHDLSRCMSSYPGEFSRMNMPFELGLDFGCKYFGGSPFDQKRILILEEKKYRYQQFISDISGNDIEAHDKEYVKAIRKVRNWITGFLSDSEMVAGKVLAKEYEDFRGFHYDELLSKGYSEEDIEDYPTGQLINAMIQWKQTGQNQ